jgi:hypothetical protein
MTTIDAELLERSFGNTFAGELISGDDDTYDTARAVWNATVDARPALIAQCRSIDDIIAAVGVARTTGSPLSVRGGARVEACGVGRVVDAAATSTELAGAVDAVLGDGASRAAARRLAAEIAALGHGEEATDRVERIGLAPPVGVEPTTVELEARCSIR